MLVAYPIFNIWSKNERTKSYREVFLRKSKDWENEHEFRWLVHSENDAPEYIPIIGILDEVLVGQDFPQVYEPSLKALCKNLSVSAKKLQWVNGIPEERPIYPP